MKNLSNNVYSRKSRQRMNNFTLNKMLIKRIKKIDASNLNYYMRKLKTSVIYIQVNNVERIEIIDRITKNRKIIK